MKDIIAKLEAIEKSCPVCGNQMCECGMTEEEKRGRGRPPKSNSIPDGESVLFDKMLNLLNAAEMAKSRGQFEKVASINDELDQVEQRALAKLGKEAVNRFWNNYYSATDMDLALEEAVGSKKDNAVRILKGVVKYMQDTGSPPGKALLWALRNPKKAVVIGAAFFYTEETFAAINWTWSLATDPWATIMTTFTYVTTPEPNGFISSAFDKARGLFGFSNYGQALEDFREITGRNSSITRAALWVWEMIREYALPIVAISYMFNNTKELFNFIKNNDPDQKGKSSKNTSRQSPAVDQDDSNDGTIGIRGNRPMPTIKRDDSDDKQPREGKEKMKFNESSNWNVLYDSNHAKNVRARVRIPNMNEEEVREWFTGTFQPLQIHELYQDPNEIIDEDDMEEGNEFTGALARAQDSGAKEFEVGGKTYPVKENSDGAKNPTAFEKTFTITYEDLRTGETKQKTFNNDKEWDRWLDQQKAGRIKVLSYSEGPVEENTAGAPVATPPGAKTTNAPDKNTANKSTRSAAVFPAGKVIPKPPGTTTITLNVPRDTIKPPGGTITVGPADTPADTPAQMKESDRQMRGELTTREMGDMMAQVHAELNGKYDLANQEKTLRSIAKESGMPFVDILGPWVERSDGLKKAIEAVKASQDETPPDAGMQPQMPSNASPDQFRNAGLMESLTDLLKITDYSGREIDLYKEIIAEIDGHGRKYKRYYPKQLVDELIGKAVKVKPFDPDSSWINYRDTIAGMVLGELKKSAPKSDDPREIMARPWEEPPGYDAKPGIVSERTRNIAENKSITGLMESHSLNLEIADHHEVRMAQSDLYKTVKNAAALHNMLDGMDELEGWVQAKITLAADYLDKVRHYLEYERISKNKL